MTLSVDAVTLDAYGTLFEGGSDDLIRLVERLVAEAEADVTLEGALARREELIGELEHRPFLRMRARDDWILRTLFAEFGIGRDPSEDVEALHRTYFNVRLYPDAKPCVEALRDAGYRLAVVSNSDVEMMDKILEEHGLADLVDAVVTSERAGAYKPAPPMFEAAAEAVGAKPARVLHVGDSYTADVVGAKRAGMRAAWLKRPGGLPPPANASHPPDLTVERLSELPDELSRR